MSAQNFVCFTWAGGPEEESDEPPSSNQPCSSRAQTLLKKKKKKKKESCTQTLRRIILLPLPSPTTTASHVRRIRLFSPAAGGHPRNPHPRPTRRPGPPMH